MYVRNPAPAHRSPLREREIYQLSWHIVFASGNTAASLVVVARRIGIARTKRHPANVVRIKGRKATSAGE